MAIKKVLVAVKTYPTISGKYDELVCTAGFLEDGSWIRIYPIPFRKITYDEQYKKYDWIEIDLVKNTRDFRPESYRPYSLDKEINIVRVGHISTENKWAERKKFVLKKVYTDLDELIKEAKDQNICTSLAVFKPTKVLNFKIENVAREWDKNKLADLEAERAQLDLFKQPENPFEVIKKLPYKFSYKIIDAKGKESTMMIEDWEIGQLYWNCLKSHNGNEIKATEDVKKKYFDNFAKTKDLHLFLSTTLLHHYVSHNPFMIIGTFHPKKVTQISLF